MSKYIVCVAVSVMLVLICLNAHALFILDPAKDFKTVKKEIQNEDGTTTTIEEPEIIKPFANVEIPAEVAEEIKTRQKSTIAKGLENRLGLFKPQKSMFTVTTKRPENWPIMNSRGKITVADSKTKENPVSYGWMISAISLGIIAFASFKLYMHFKGEPDITKV